MGNRVARNKSEAPKLCLISGDPLRDQNTSVCVGEIYEYLDFLRDT